MGLIGYEKEIGHLILKLIPIGDEGQILKDEELEEEVEEPFDLIEKKISCHYMIKFDKIVFFDISEIFNKTCYLNY